MIVMKFGGSSLGTPLRVRGAIDLVKRELPRNPVVVVSAHGKTTDALLGAARSALAGTVDTTEVEQYHLGLADELEVDHRVVNPLLNQLSQLLHGVCLLGELTPRTLDHVMSFGERMSSRMFAAALGAEGVPATAVNAWDVGLVTTSRHGCAAPLPGIDDRICHEIGKLGLVPVITGFLGKDERGNITTLGRSGSDFSASIIGAALDAEEIQIWTDVNGVMTCDPSLDPRARSLPLLSFNEASELAYYGAEVLHPSTLVPAIRKGVPVRVLNTGQPSDPGTTIVARPVMGDLMAKSVVYKENVCLIGMASPRLMSAVEMLARAFSVLEGHEIGIHMATTSEASVSMVTDRDTSCQVLDAAMDDLRKLGDVEIQSGLAIICVVGEELRGQPRVTGRIFGAVEARGVKPLMVSRSSLAINVAFLARNEEIEPAVLVLHELILGSCRASLETGQG